MTDIDTVKARDARRALALRGFCTACRATPSLYATDAEFAEWVNAHTQSCEVMRDPQPARLTLGEP